MSPAHFFTGDAKSNSPVSTTQDSTAISLWSRVNQSVKHSNDTADLMRELMYRYEFLSQQYQSEVSAREQERAAVLAWQQDKQQYEHTFKTMQMALERNPFVIVLIDGDSMVFNNELIRDGEKGGRRAAVQLHTAVMNYIEREVTNVPTESRIICRIYANVRGLAESLVRTGVVEDLLTVEEFVRGFTRGKTLFDFVDVGPGKDRANEKLIETFKVYANDFHCRRIFLGCSNDNGYVRALEEYSDDGICLEKVILTESVPFEKELLSLPFATKKFPGIFRESKLSVFPSGFTPAPTESPPAKVRNYNIIGGLPTRFPPPVRPSSSGASHLMDSPIPTKASLNLPRTPSSSTLASDGIPATKPGPMNWAAKAVAPAPNGSDGPSYKPANREEIIARNRLGQRVDPPCRDYDKAEVDRIKKIKMCNVHFLRQECPYGSMCTHSHNYKPTKEELATLRLVARMAPCQNGSSCQDIKCIYGHRCPAPTAKTNPVKGTKTCIFGDACKFPSDLHDIDCNVVKTLVVR